VAHGESLDFHVTTTPAQPFEVDIYRMGHYQGLGGRLMQHVSNLAGVTQPPCPVAASTGMIECPWSTSYTLSIPPTWTTGVYLAVLTNQARFQNYVTFVVRDDSRAPALMYQAAVTTYQAYNNYPNDGLTGKSLYEAGKAPSYGANTVAGTPRAVKVSFDRPYSGDGDGEFLKWEVYLVRWMEHMGYDVGYSTNIDTSISGSRLLDVKGFVSAGHDEYWSKPMLDAVENARDSGVGLAFLSGNSAYFQIRFEPSPTTGAANRVIVSYKNAAIDPVQGELVTVRWRDAALGKPEQRLLGAQYTPSFDEDDPYFPYVVRDSSHWAFAGTGVTDGTTIPGVIGYEVDRIHPGVATPDAVPGTYTMLSQSPFVSSLEGLSLAHSTMYQNTSGAWVFDAGTIGWSWGLAKGNVIDARIQRITINVFARFLAANGAVPPAPPSGLSATAASPHQITLQWTDNANNESGFVIERSTTNDFLNVQAFTAPKNATGASQTDVTPGSTYFVRVRAANARGTSDWSNTAIVPVPVTPAYRDTVLADGPFAYWRFGETLGPLAVSQTGLGTGSYSGGFSLGQPGAVAGDPDTALTLNGSNGFVNVPHSASFNVGDTFTFETWFRRGALGTDQRLLFKGTNWAVVQLTASNRIRFAKSGAGDIALSTITITDTSSWHHLVVTKNGAQAKIYLDGVDVTGPVTSVTITNTSSAVNIGRDSGGSQHFNGSLDETALYNFVLPQTRVVAHYAAGRGSA
jgi:hypothetical protein